MKKIITIALATCALGCHNDDISSNEKNNFRAYEKINLSYAYRSGYLEGAIAGVELDRANNFYNNTIGMHLTTDSLNYFKSIR